jgi:hypothetical protein
MKEILGNLIQSKVKRKLLKFFLFNKNRKVHTRELNRLVDEPISAVQRELKKLLDLQIIHKYPEGNVVNYFVNTQNPFYEDLKALFLKATTEPRDYFKLLINTKSLLTVALFGDTVRVPMNFSLPVSLLVVGTLDEEILHEYLKSTMDIFNRDYELLYYSPEAFVEAQANDRKIKDILRSKYLLYLKQS